MNLQRWVTFAVTALSAPLYALAVFGMAVMAARAIRDGVPFYTPMMAILLLGFLLEARGLLIAWTLKEVSPHENDRP